MMKKGYKNDGSQAVHLERVSKPRVPLTIHFLQRWVAACSGGRIHTQTVPNLVTSSIFKDLEFYVQMWSEVYSWSQS